MKKQKQVYLSPETETLVIRFEGVICQSGLGVPGAAGQGFQNGGNINDYTGFDF